MEEKCFACEKSDDEVVLFDAIYGREMVKVCRGCSVKGNVIIIKRPSGSQLIESEKPDTIYERLSKMAGLPVEKKLVRERKEEPEKPFQLIDNFNWHIQRARRKKGLSLKQFAEAIAESEAVVKMIENSELPQNAESVVRKIEQFLRIKLRKTNYLEREERRIKEIAAGKSIKTETKVVMQETPGPARILTLNKEAIEKLTIADLKKLKEEREKLKKIELLEKEAKEKEKEWKGLTKEEREELRKKQEEQKEKIQEENEIKEEQRSE